MWIFSAPFLPEDVVYQGRVSENGGVVEVYPEIKAENGPICGFRIVNTDVPKNYKHPLNFAVLIFAVLNIRGFYI